MAVLPKQHARCDFRRKAHREDGRLKRGGVSTGARERNGNCRFESIGGLWVINPDKDMSRHKLGASESAGGFEGWKD